MIKYFSIKIYIPTRTTSTLLFFFFLSNLLLTLGFYSNHLNNIENRKIQPNKTSASRLIIGRMVKSRRDGLFSGGGLLGTVGPIPSGSTEAGFQNEAYSFNLPFQSYTRYNSQIGFQGVTYSLFDKLTSLSPVKTIRALLFLNMILSSLVLSAIIVWCYLECGVTSASIVLITIFSSKWLTAWSGGLELVMWTLFFPFAASLFTVKYAKSYHVPLIIIFIAIFVKCLYSGYNLITPVLVMIISPYIYYSISEGWSLKNSLKKILAASLVAIMSVLTSILVLVFQLSVAGGSISEGFRHIIKSLVKRSISDPGQQSGVVADSLRSGVLEVLEKYFSGVIFDWNTFFGSSEKFLVIAYKNVIFLFLFVSLLVLLIGVFNRTIFIKKLSIKTRRLYALCLTTWFSVLGPLSWYVIFKAHAYLHMKEDFLAWHMPFTLFGFALVGLTLEYLITETISTSMPGKVEGANES